MIVGRAPRMRQTFAAPWRVLAALFVWDCAVTVFYYASPFSAPALPLTLFGTVLALYIGFRVNSAYERWWEGRSLWGLMINASRSIARGTIAFFPDDRGGRALKRRLVLRQIAYVNALRCQLRRQDPAPEALRLLDDGDGRTAITLVNPANGLLTGASRIIAEAQRDGLIDTIQQTQLEAVLIAIANAQGGMERLKNTPLPAQYRSFPVFFTRLFCLLLPVGLVETLAWATPIGSSVAGLMFLAALRIGDDLVDPFANTVHDVPLTQMCGTIEIDLKQMIGDPAPAPHTAVDGVLW